MTRPAAAAADLLETYRRARQPIVDLQADRERLAAITADPKTLLYRLHRKGLAHPLQRGRFFIELDGRPAPAPRFDTLDPLAEGLLRRLGHPYLISWHSALWRHGLIDQQSMALRVAVTARKRSAVIGRAQIRFITVAQRKLFGEDPAILSKTGLHVAAPEKAILDSIDQPHLAGGMAAAISALSTAWTLGELDHERLTAWALRFESPTLNRRLGYLMDQIQVPGSDVLLPHVGRKSSVTLSPGNASPYGSVDPKWRVREDLVLLTAGLHPR